MPDVRALLLPAAVVLGVAMVVAAVALLATLGYALLVAGLALVALGKGWL